MESNFELIIVPLVMRVLLAAFIVILVAKLVVKLGPSMGGLIAGLPVGLGPGFYFLMRYILITYGEKICTGTQNISELIIKNFSLIIFVSRYIEDGYTRKGHFRNYPQTLLPQTIL